MDTEGILEELSKSIGQAFNEEFKGILMKELVHDAVQEVLGDRELTFEKTEEILYAYPDLQYAYETRLTIYGKEDELVEKLRTNLEFIEECLDSVTNDRYFKIIELIYFQKKSANSACVHYKTTPRTISYNRKRLVNQLRTKFFSLEYLKELMFT